MFLCSSLPSSLSLSHSKELSKALRALHTLTSDPEEDQDEEKEQRLREMAGKLQELCNQEVGEGEVPNALKIIQIHLKYTLMHSEKIAGVKYFYVYTYMWCIMQCCAVY